MRNGIALFVLLSSSLFLAPAALAQTADMDLAPIESVEEPNRWFAYGTDGGGGRAGKGSGVGGVGHAGIRYRFARTWWADVQVGEGYFLRPEEMVGRIGGGVRWEAARPGFRPSMYLGFAHAHELGLDHARHAPIQNATATHPDMRHRTGVEGGFALSTPAARIVLPPRLPPIRLFARVTAAWYPDNEPAPVYLLGDLGLGVEF